MFFSLVWSYVDELQNPQIFTRDRLQQTLERNEEINGKNETLARFADTLAVELSSKFPTEMAQYRLWRSRPPGKDWWLFVVQRDSAFLSYWKSVNSKIKTKRSEIPMIFLLRIYFCFCFEFFSFFFYKSKTRERSKCVKNFDEWELNMDKNVLNSDWPKVCLLIVK